MGGLCSKNDIPDTDMPQSKPLRNSRDLPLSGEIYAPEEDEQPATVVEKKEEMKER